VVEAGRGQSRCCFGRRSVTAAALPQTALRDRGYKGLIYQTHGAASMDFIRIAGPAAEGVIMASGPVMSPETQPDSALTKKPGLALNTPMRREYGPQQPQPVRRTFLRMPLRCSSAWSRWH